MRLFAAGHVGGGYLPELRICEYLPLYQDLQAVFRHDAIQLFGRIQTAGCKWGSTQLSCISGGRCIKDSTALCTVATPRISSSSAGVSEWTASRDGLFECTECIFRSHPIDWLFLSWYLRYLRKPYFIRHCKFPAKVLVPAAVCQRRSEGSFLPVYVDGSYLKTAK